PPVSEARLLFSVFALLSTIHLEYCPPHCQCEWEIHSVSCFGVEVVPVFHSSTKEVWLLGTKMYSISENAFANLANISQIYISDDSTLRYLERHSFYNLSRVTHIQLNGIKTLSYIDQDAFKNLPNLKYLGITNTGLTTFPELQHIHSSQEHFILEMVENVFIQVIPANSFTGISLNTLTIVLNSNGVKEIQDYAFNGTKLEEVYLDRNLDLEQIEEFAFYGVIQGPTHLDLSDTKVHSLPSIGMKNIEKLQAKNTWALKMLPSFRAFCSLTKLFRWKVLHSEAVICNLTWATSGKLQLSSATLSQRYLEYNISQHLKSEKFGIPTHGSANSNRNSLICPTKKSQDDTLFYVKTYSEHLSEVFDSSLCNELDADDGPSCTPLPDALNPCEDVMSKDILRILVWVVSLFAISANLLVLVILLTSRQKMSVTRFLIGHLAFADCCMGFYLLVIAFVDFYTRSNYHHYAITWQTGSGCNIVGTLSVFASELSVFTLTLISLQRWNAIFSAIRPDRKMRLRHASVLMLVGWLLCVFLALLPVLGVSSYQKVSICLPMDTGTTAARTYIISVLIVNVTAFMVVCLCYIHIYFMVHNPNHNSSRYDTSMAKRMAVIIFTNFLCLAPTCFYGLSAAFHHPMITVTDSKVLLYMLVIFNAPPPPIYNKGYVFFSTGAAGSFLSSQLLHQPIFLCYLDKGISQRHPDDAESDGSLSTASTPLSKPTSQYYSLHIKKFSTPKSSIHIPPKIRLKKQKMAF
uniref:Thyrotropin receptor n=1 Tax=Oreochromis niloticus TaxID=8128 RepID=I3KLR3_ORENI